MPTPAQKIKIIITDDHRIYRQGIKNALAAKTDIEFIAEAEHGRDLLDKLEYLQPDMVTIGLQMPVMNGLQTIPILKTKYPAIKIIVITMVNDASIICRVMQLGANAYLTKSASSAEIYEAILACRDSWLFINDTLRGALPVTKPG